MKVCLIFSVRNLDFWYYIIYKAFHIVSEEQKNNQKYKERSGKGALNDSAFGCDFEGVEFVAFDYFNLRIDKLSHDFGEVDTRVTPFALLITTISFRAPEMDFGVGKTYCLGLQKII